jgi:hypothetical protein
MTCQAATQCSLCLHSQVHHPYSSCAALLVRGKNQAGQLLAGGEDGQKHLRIDPILCAARIWGDFGPDSQYEYTHIPHPPHKPACCVIQVARYGQYRGYNSLGIMCQNLENPHLRKALGMPQGATGVLINNVQQTSTAAKVWATWPLPACTKQWWKRLASRQPMMSLGP